MEARMSQVMRFARSSIGAKVVMAVSGVALVSFVLMHMAGNLLVFRGPKALNDYAQGLHDLGPLLWVARAGLLAMVVAHILSGLRLAKLNRAARPVAYSHKRNLVAGLSGRTMALSGLLLLAFIVYHLIHFTFSKNPHVDGARPDVYTMVITGFRQPLVSGSYIVAMVFLGLHLYHGAGSLFQSLGLATPKFKPTLDRLGALLAVSVFIGNTSMPLAVLLGLVGGVR
jgi:succinate dehydrogenase / fumarate reductase cytochrome b subunit